MKRFYLITLLFFYLSISYGQSFEGQLIYSVEFEVKAQKIGNIEITKDQILDKMKSDGEYFDKVTLSIKDGNYEKLDNSDLQKRVVYKADENKIYTLQEGFLYVMITDAAHNNFTILDFPEPTIEIIDSIKMINGYECTLLQMTWGKLGSEQCFYNSDYIKIDHSFFKHHNYEYLNQVVEITNAYPIEIVKKVSDFISIRLSLIDASFDNIDASHFSLPTMVDAEKDYTEMMLKMSNVQVKKIKK